MICQPAAASEGVQILIAAPLTGPRALQGAEMRDAVSLAQHATAAGGRPLPIEMRDDTCSARGGAALAAELADVRPPSVRPIVVGHPCSSAAGAAAPLYRAAGIVFLSTAVPSPTAANGFAGAPVLTLVPMEPSEGAFLGRSAAAAVSMRPPGRLAVVSDATASMRSIATEAARAIRASAGGEPLIVTLPAGARDLSAIADTLAAANVTAIVLAAFPAEAWILVGDLWRRGQAPTIWAASPLAAEPPPPETRSAAGLRQIRVALRPTFLSSEEGRALRARAITHLGRPPSATTVLSLVAIEIAQQLRDAPLPTIEDTRTRRFETSIGPLTFDSAGMSDLPRWSSYRFSDSGLVED